jgi:hypothetical protein
MALTEAQKKAMADGAASTEKVEVQSNKRGTDRSVPATPEQSSDMSVRLQDAQKQLQLSDIEAAHQVSDAAVARIKKASAGLTAFKLVEQSSDITRDAVGLYSRFLDGMPSTDTVGLADLMDRTTLDQNFLSMALNTPRQLTGA